MQSFVEKARVYMVALMKAGDFSVEDVAAMTESSVNTIKNFIYKKTTKNPGFDSIVNWILGLGGDLNELVGYKQKQETEANSIASLKETYELKLVEMEKHCEQRIEDIKELSDIRVEDVRKDCELRILDLKEAQAEFIKMIMSAK